MTNIKIITDLSNEYHPVPKPLKRVKMPKPVKKEGKKTINWSQEREKLKVMFALMKITTCEARLPGCWHNTALGFAHKAKRRKLTPDDLDQVALLCNPCHQIIEAYPAQRMEETIQALIDERKPRK